MARKMGLKFISKEMLEKVLSPAHLLDFPPQLSLSRTTTNTT
jgi:hypothetical protein